MKSKTISYIKETLNIINKHPNATTLDINLVKNMFADILLYEAEAEAEAEEESKALEDDVVDVSNDHLFEIFPESVGMVSFAEAMKNHPKGMKCHIINNGICVDTDEWYSIQKINKIVKMKGN